MKNNIKQNPKQQSTHFSVPNQIGRASKFTDEQRFEIALDMLSGKMSVSEVCRKWDIGSTYAYKLKDRVMELLRNGIGRQEADLFYRLLLS